MTPAACLGMEGGGVAEEEASRAASSWACSSSTALRSASISKLSTSLTFRSSVMAACLPSTAQCRSRMAPSRCWMVACLLSTARRRSRMAPSRCWMVACCCWMVACLLLHLDACHEWWLSWWRALWTAARWRSESWRLCLSMQPALPASCSPPDTATCRHHHRIKR